MYGDNMIEAIIGTERVRIDNVIKEILHNDSEVYGEQEIIKFSTKDKEFNFDRIHNSMNTVSLFELRKCIILYVYDKDMNQDKDSQLSEIIKNDNPEVLLVIVFDKKPLVKSKVKKPLEEKARLTKIDTFNPMQKSAYIIQKLKLSGIFLTSAVAHEFERRVGNDLMRLDKEIEKLSVLDREITLEDIKLLVSQDLDDNIFALSDALLKKDLKGCLSVYQTLLQLKIDPLALFGMLASSIRRNYQVNILSSMHMSSQEISVQLGMSDKQAYFISKNQKMDPKNSLRLLNILASREQEAKNGKTDRFVALELFLIDATSS